MTVKERKNGGRAKRRAEHHVCLCSTVGKTREISSLPTVSKRRLACPSRVMTTP